MVIYDVRISIREGAQGSGEKVRKESQKTEY